MVEGNRRALSLGMAAISVGAMTQLAAPDAWYVPCLWAIALALGIFSLFMWFWPSIRPDASALSSKLLGRRPLLGRTSDPQIPSPLPQEREALLEMGRIVEQTLVPFLREAAGFAASLVANLDHRGKEPTIDLLNDLRLRAIDAFQGARDYAAINQRYASIEVEASTYYKVYDRWWEAYNEVLSGVGELPLPPMSQEQMARFLRSDLAKWNEANSEASGWADGFVSRLRSERFLGG